MWSWSVRFHQTLVDLKPLCKQGQPVGTKLLARSNKSRITSAEFSAAPRCKDPALPSASIVGGFLTEIMSFSKTSLDKKVRVGSNYMISIIL